MRTVILVATLVCTAWGQTPADPGVERDFHFTFIESPQGVQEVINSMRAILEITQFKFANDARTLTIRGTPDQLAAATWLFPELDKPGGAREYRLAGTPTNVVRVFYLTKTTTPRGVQEVVNGVRSIVDIQRATVINATRAVVLRGTEEQISAADWLIQGIDVTAGTQPAPVLSYKIDDARSPAVRIVYLSGAQTALGVQEIVNAVRSLGDVQRVVACQAPKAIVLRGSEEQAAMAEWLIGALDRPPAATTYNLASTGDVARVFYLQPNPGPEALQQLSNSVRSGAKIQRTTPVSRTGAIAVRGTVGQVAMAEKLIQAKDQH